MGNKGKKRSFGLNQQFKNQVDLIIPVYHPNDKFKKLLEKLMMQTIKPNKIFIMHTVEDESIQLEIPDIAKDIVEIHLIKKEDFDHGATRRYGADLSESDIIMLMTQDAIPADEFLIEKMVIPFNDSKVAVSYARQIPYKNANLLEKMTRVYNYPNKKEVKSSRDIQRLGIKTFFCSNVCAAYRKEAYEKAGGFVEKTIFNEDMIMAFALVGIGYKIAYAADAKVFHSHNYSYLQHFRRNFDLGVSHRQYSELFRSVKSESEGIKMIFTLTNALIKRKKYSALIELVITSGFKFMGYKLGYYYRILPKKFVNLFTMNKSFW